MEKMYLIVFCLLFTAVSYSQQPELKFDSLKVLNGDSVTVSVYVKNFTNIGAITIKIITDTSSLSFGRAFNWDTQLNGALYGVVDNRIALAWDGLDGVNISDGKLVDLKFLFKGNSSGLIFDTVLTEIANLQGEPVSVHYINGSVSSLTSVNEKYINNKPINYLIEQNYPNPFNPNTTLSYQLINNSYVSLKVFDILGKEVVALVDKEKQAGTYSIQFQAINLPSGIYFYRLDAIETNGGKSFTQTKKMILLK